MLNVPVFYFFGFKLSAMQSQNSNIDLKALIKPAVIVDLQGINLYSDALRRIFTTFSGFSHQSCIIIPPAGHVGPIISPSVTIIRHPQLAFPLLWHRSREILVSQLKKFAPTVLHCFSPKKLSLTQYLSRKLNVPYVFTIDSAARNVLKKALDDPSCASVIISSDNRKGLLKKQFTSCEQKISYIPMGVFVEDRCAAFNQPQRITSMLVARKLNDHHQFEPLLNAVRHLAVDGHEFIMAIMGKGRAERKLYKVIKNLGLGQLVTVVPEMTPLRDIMSGADIFIQPKPVLKDRSNLLEAMSVGMAIACSEKDDPELLKDSMTAVTFDPEDELSIYNALQRLLTDKDFARSIAASAQQHLRNRNKVSEMIDGLIRVYSDAIEKHGLQKVKTASLSTA
jgi:glycosyltransferase involved in cell wall biosynthesis